MNEPKILFVDIETFPNLAHIWRLWEANALSVERNSIICCFSAKWHGGKQVTKALSDYSGYRKGSMDDTKIVNDLWKLLDEADIVVAQNGDKFDIKKMNTRFVNYKLDPPSPYKTVDTLKVARNIFGFDSNHLTDLGKYLGLGEKVETGGFKLWQDCMAGKPAAWKLMKKYNTWDVVLLEKVYNRFLPWMTNHPNVGMYTDKLVCMNCGSGKLQSRGFAITRTTKYKRVQCLSCGAWGRVGNNIKVERPVVHV